MFRETKKIFISGVDGKVTPYRHSADQEIGIGSLHSFCSAKIKKFRSHDVIIGFKCQIRKGSKMLLESFKLRLLTQT